MTMIYKRYLYSRGIREENKIFLRSCLQKKKKFFNIENVLALSSVEC